MSQRKMRFDASGNLTYDNYTGSGSRAYDAENRLIAAADRSNSTSTYGYDAEGRRVRRTAGTKGEQWQIYGFDGELLAEYSAGTASFLPLKEYGYRGRQLLISGSNGDGERLIRFVNQLYLGALARSATKEELEYGSNSLAAAGAQGPAFLLVESKQFAQFLFTSTEYANRNRSDSEYVEDLYWAYFDRSAELYTIEYWVGRLQSSGSDHISREGLRQVCENWNEFSTIVSALQGGNVQGDNERTQHFLWNVYLGGTGSIPSSQLLQPSVDALNVASAQGQEAVIAHAEQICRAIVSSSEYEDRHRTDEEYVADLFQMFWQQPPDTESWIYWTQEVATQGRERVLDVFAGSKAFKQSAGALYREILWLVPDQLGTPRMAAERTGLLAGIKRHDYLPFGEELLAGVGGRTIEQGYMADGVRQQFTSKEKDDETGLNYFLARYYSSTQGRFTTTDEFPGGAVESFADLAESNPTFYAELSNPQSLNKYQYCLNNPLRFIDPFGHQQDQGWYDRLMAFLGLLWKSSGNGDNGMNYGSSEQGTKRDSGNGPVDLGAQKVARQSWLLAGAGLNELANIEMMLFDWTGVVGNAKQLMDGDYAGFGMSVVVRAGGPVLSKFFKVAKVSDLLTGRLLHGSDATREIAAQFTKSGGTLTADIVYIGSKSQKGLATLVRDVQQNVIALAQQQGASEATINAVAVVNEALERKLIKNGWKKTTVWIEGFGETEAFTKTFRLTK